MQRLLNPAEIPQLYHLLQGHMDEYLQCADASCNHSRLSSGADFSSLQLAVATGDGAVVHNVQEALDRHFAEEQVEVLCPHCGRTRQAWKKHVVTRCPHVLPLSLKRWVGYGAAAVLNPIEVTNTLQLMDQQYNLCAVVVHLGSTPKAGHYITVARHEINGGSWWLYDDWRSVIAKPEEISTLCTYRMSPMKSYVLLYER